MSSYLIVLSRSAQKEIDSLPGEIIDRISPKIDALGLNPRPPNCLKLSSKENEWRIRVGDYRIVYTIDDNTKTIDITKIRHRREVYQN